MEIREKINDGTYNILYISPETFLGRADIQDLIGERKIGMFIIDEAHIVTTWGKQFRPDYWYLGDHLEKLKKQSPLNSGFLIATFTATAIYKGEEDMFEETKSSLHLFNPIVYLGYIKRDNISIEIDRSKKADNVRTELEFDKFGELEILVDEASENKEKLLIYFPTVRLLNRFVDYIRSRKKQGLLLKYHGQLTKEEKDENYIQFMDSEKYAMAATKAFGMGIDISDIHKVAHFAPTGNVCDYVQEIGRAARKKSIEGEAFYHYNSRDFGHINRLHGMSAITKTQLIQVLHKVYELFISNRKMGSNNGSKSNSLLIDTNTFSSIFDNKGGDEENIVNKIKTALLMIQKDFIAKMGFSPISVKPIPLFSHGYFRIDEKDQPKLIKKFGPVLEICDGPMKIVKLNLESIWKQSYTDLSFPKFKFHIYSSRDDLDFFKDFHYTPAVYVQIDFKSDANSQYSNVITVLSSILKRFITEGKYYSKDEIVEAFITDYSKTGFTKLNKSRVYTIVQSFISTCLYNKGRLSTNYNIIYEKPLINGDIKYQFRFGADSVIQFISKGKSTIFESTKEGEFYIVDYSGNEMKDYTAILGFLESIGILNFKMLGGENSQLYIYINQIQSITNILNSPGKYQNKLLKTIDYRHRLSAKMLTYIYEREFSSADIWNIIEDYFLGKIPEWVREEVKLDEERRNAEWRKRNFKN